MPKYLINMTLIVNAKSKKEADNIAWKIVNVTLPSLEIARSIEDWHYCGPKLLLY